MQALDAIKGMSKQFIKGLSEEKKGLEVELERARRAYAEAPLLASLIRLKTFDCVPRLAGRRAPLIASLIGLSASDCLPHELAGHTPIRTAPGSSL